jgi:hypothetical protein
MDQNSLMRSSVTENKYGKGEVRHWALLSQFINYKGL